MKIVVLGSSGRIGERLVRNLRQSDLRVYEASPTSGVDAVTGAGMREAMEDAEIVVDVTNAPSFATDESFRFFDTAGRNIFSLEHAASVRHHILLSIVGLDGLADEGYFRAKKHQEALVRASGVPYTIVRSTQFFEFISDVVRNGNDREIAISPACVQPIAGDDVAEALTDVVLTDPGFGVFEIAGPQQFRMSDIAIEIATAYEDGRQIIADRHARYFGAELDDTSLLPTSAARLGHRLFDDWLRASLAVPAFAPMFSL